VQKDPALVGRDARQLVEAECGGSHVDLARSHLRTLARTSQGVAQRCPLPARWILPIWRSGGAVRLSLFGNGEDGMALKYPLWFLGKCLDEERGRSPLAHLAGRALDLGLRRTDATRGHVFQAVGALQKFFEANPAMKNRARVASPVAPYKPRARELQAWVAFLHANSGGFGSSRLGFRYDYDTLKGYLTRKYGGQRRGGGGGDNEFEIVWRLLADFYP
jgi:hypothetical protein